MSHVPQAVPSAPALSDIVALTKPRIMAMSLLTAIGGMSLAPGVPSLSAWLALMIGTGLIVGAANTLNMYLERDVDCMMSRTRSRPLPAGRMEPAFALAFGILQAMVSVPVLTFALNPLTGMLGVLALLSYVMVYTPLKRRTTLATLIGSFPGAAPVLMGWSAATGTIDLAGVSVFGVLFLWQIPHFHAIAMFRHKEYDRAGLKTLPRERGAAAARLQIVLYLVLQVAVSLSLYPLGVAGIVYEIVAAAIGLGYLAYGLTGLRHGDPRWARNLFLISIAYLPVLFLVLVMDGRM